MASLSSPHATEGCSLYRISGLLVSSEVPFPSASLAENTDQPPDVTIRAGAVPRHLSSPETAHDAWESGRDRFLFLIRSVGRFLISNGNSITFALNPGIPPRNAAPYLLGSCFAILLQQRGNLVLHASAIAVAGRAMLFCGSSGSGKSTTAALLCRRGHALLNDDVCNLIPGPDDTFRVQPDGRMLKLWSASLDQLDWQASPDMAIRDDVDKFFFAPPAAEPEPKPIAAIYILRDAPADTEPSITALRPLQAVVELKTNAYRPGLLGPMQLQDAYFRASVALHRSAGVFTLSRPKDFSASDALITALESHWKTLPQRDILSAQAP